ncbi:hypothetical protein BJ322DRAFT_1104897 [Thelephora terrestris]|uniref:F-box domain-containing protein n=1 Tax=Thelephora terrestris TaxID=56493 RepID=A0A9P6LBJ8_9AGAM|nr:hypothetical protein BJ322DRAFT_1104897 [Thelephora terrestris]
MSDEAPRTVGLCDIADDLGQRVTDVCATLFERQRAGEDVNSTHLELAPLERKLSMVIVELRRSKNAARPINRLPREILANVFLFFRCEVPPTHHPEYTTAPPFHLWIRSVIHVCHHWRETALMFPSLWSTVDVTGPEIVDAFTFRSGSLPLHVHVRFEGRCCRRSRNASDSDLARDTNLGFIGNLADHSGRFRTFTLVYPLEDGGPLSDFHLPAPLLETLVIHPPAHVGNRNPFAGVHHRATPSLPTIFARSLPSLRVLRVIYFTIWPNNRFHNLSVLCLAAQRNLEHSMGQLLDLFQCSPTLQDILLEQEDTGIGRVPPASDLSDITPVPLNKLQRLYLSGFAHHGISRLLSLIQLPTAIDVAIRFDGVRFPPQDPTIHDMFPPNYPPEHRLQGATRIEIGCTSAGLRLISCGPYSSVFLSTAAHHQMNSFIPQGLRRLFSSPLPAARELWIESGLTSRSAYPTIFAAVPELEDLVITDRFLPPDTAILHALLPSENSGHIPLPHLQTITLQTRYLPADKFLEVASSRAKAGIPFQDVKVYRRVGKDGIEVENAKLRENLAGLVEGCVSVEMVSPDYQDSRIAVPEVCTVDDFLWPSWRDRTKA